MRTVYLYSTSHHFMKYIILLHTFSTSFFFVFLILFFPAMKALHALKLKETHTHAHVLYPIANTKATILESHTTAYEHNVQYGVNHSCNKSHIHFIRISIK